MLSVIVYPSGFNGGNEDKGAKAHGWNGDGGTTLPNSANTDYVAPVTARVNPFLLWPHSQR